LAGRTLQIHLRGLDVTAHLVFHPDRIRVTSAGDVAPDARVSASPPALVRMLRSRADRPTLPADVVISGDADLVFEVKCFIDALEVVWEEEVALVLGDPTARLLGRVVRGGIDWTRHAGRTLVEDVVEYLGQEAELAVHRGEARAHSEEVERLRDDVERLAQRVERLRRVAREKSE
jgi:ubiquinone biosynthesis protein UbiJ